MSSIYYLFIINMKQKIFRVGGCQGITLPEGNKVYTLIRMQCCDPGHIFLFGMPLFCKPVSQLNKMNNC